MDDQGRRLPVRLEIDARREPVAHEKWQDVISVDSLRRGNVDLDLVCEVEDGPGPLSFPQQPDRTATRSRGPRPTAELPRWGRHNRAASSPRRARAPGVDPRRARRTAAACSRAASARSPTSDPTRNRLGSTGRCLSPCQRPSPAQRERTAASSPPAPQRGPPRARLSGALAPECRRGARNAVVPRLRRAPDERGPPPLSCRPTIPTRALCSCR